MSIASLRKNQKLRVGLAQVDCESGEVLDNIDKIKRIISKYRKKVDLLVFPEYSLAGYVTGKAIYDCALRTDDKAFKDLARATKGITVAVGFIEETAAFNFYNSLAFFQDGKLLNIHRKIYLINYGVFEERKHLAVGPGYQCVDIGPFRVAPFICGDAWNPALAHLAAADLAHVFLIPACSPTKGLGGRFSTQESWKRLNRFYASMYGVYTVFVNRVGRDKDLDFWGQSEVIDPFGATVAASSEAKEEIVTCVLDLQQVREARTILNTVRDEDLDFIQRRLQKVMGKHYI